MKILLLIVAIFCSILCGIVISRHFSRRKYFYIDLCDFCQFYKVKISYSRQKLSQIILEASSKYHKEFEIFLSSYVRYIDGEVDANTLSLNLSFLDKEEKRQILDYFLSLGSMTIDEEIEKQSNYFATFDITRKTSEMQNNKFSTLYVKLFICLAVFIFIIFI